MGLRKVIAERRAARDAAAAADGAPVEHVVVVEGAGRPHSVVLEKLDRERWMVNRSGRIVRRFPVKDMTGGGA